MILAARASRAFHEYMRMRFEPAEPGRVYRKVSYGPLLDVFMLDCSRPVTWNGLILERACNRAHMTARDDSFTTGPRGWPAYALAQHGMARSRARTTEAHGVTRRVGSPLARSDRC